MPRLFRPALIALFGISVWLAPAQAQDTAQDQDNVGEQAATEEPAAPEQMADLSLDALFGRLTASKDDKEAARYTKEISERWSTSGSDTLDLLLIRGRKAMRSGDHDKAVAHFSRLIAFAPEFAEGWNARATAYFAQEDFGYALADLYHVMRLEPRHFGALSGMALIFESLDMERQALTAYREALTIHPHLDGAKAGVERLEEKVQGQPI